MIRKYQNFELIKDNSLLAAFFNHVMKEVEVLRYLCSPFSFRKDDAIASFQDERFADYCRYELWMHETVSRLRWWIGKTEEYFSEFGASWRYYAASQMMACRDDEEDIDEPCESEYRHYSLVEELNGGQRDVVAEMLPCDIKKLCTDLVFVADMDREKVLKRLFGDDLKLVKMEDGEYRELSREELELDRALRGVESEDDGKRLMGIVGGICGIYKILKTCRYDEDNVEGVTAVSECSKALLDMDYSKLHAILSPFLEKKE